MAIRQAAIQMLSAIYGVEEDGEFRCGVCGVIETTDTGLPPVGWIDDIRVQYNDGSEAQMALCSVCAPNWDTAPRRYDTKSPPPFSGTNGVQTEVER